MNRYPTWRSGRSFAFLVIILALALAVMGNASGLAAAEPERSESFASRIVPREALSLSLTTGEMAGTKGNPKLDTALTRLAERAGEPMDSILALAEEQALRLLGERVQVQITVNPQRLAEALQRLTAAGGEMTAIASDSSLIQAWLPIDQLDDLSGDPEILFIRRPHALVIQNHGQAGTLTSEGLAAMNGPAWHTAGYLGSGVKIGVIDAGFLDYPTLLGSDLPATVTVKNFVDFESDAQVNGTTEHGTACAEIIHDIAPQATLYFAKVGTNLDLQEAVAWLKDTHQVDIISISLVWYNLTPGDGTGQFATLVQGARDAGILWVSSAGNDRQAHWGGAYHDPGDTGYHYYNDVQNVNFFGPGDGSAYLIPAGYRINVFLRWDDWTQVNQDYDLHVVRWDGSTSNWLTVSSSEDWQNGGAGQTPTEYVSYTTSGNDTMYGFLISRYESDRAVNLEVFAPQLARLDKVVHARSLANLADAPAALTVAALDVTSPYPQEPYSAQGPTNGSGGSEAGGFTKPDIAAYANVSTVSYGTTTPFNGTSAAAPHTAGAAALALNANPSYDPAQLQAFLEGRAVDMGESGKDPLYGAGRLHLGTAPPPIVVPGKTYIPLVTLAVLPGVPVLNTISNPDGDGNYTVSWNAAAGANSYTLQEDTSAAFSNPTSIYNGSGTSLAVAGKEMGTHYYRVRASNWYGVSGWSDAASVEVTVPPPDGPKSGRWNGVTSQGLTILFDVSNSPDQITYLMFPVRNCWDTATIIGVYYEMPLPINNNSFDSGALGTLRVWGNFTSTTTASGNLEVRFNHTTQPWRFCMSTATWTASGP